MHFRCSRKRLDLGHCRLNHTPVRRFTVGQTVNIARFVGRIRFPNGAPSLKSLITGSRFVNNTRLTTLYPPESIRVTQSNMFNGCSNLRVVIIPYVLSIQAATFANCTLLRTITLPRSVISLGISIFQNCSLDRLTLLFPAQLLIFHQ